MSFRLQPNPALRSQRGGTFVGLVIGLVLGLAIALAVAVYVTKVPVPFMNKGQTRTSEQDAAEARKNKDWDPNAPLYGKNPARAASAAGGEPRDDVKGDGPAVADAKPAARPEVKVEGKSDAKADAKGDGKPDTKTDAKADIKADPLGDLAKAKAQVSTDPFQYFLQVGAFRSAEEAEAHRIRLSLQGLQTKVSEREQAGRTVYRVRMGPYERKEDADRQKEKLDAASIDSALVRVQR